MPFSTDIPSRRVTREMLAWKERKPKLIQQEAVIGSYYQGQYNVNLAANSWNNIPIKANDVRVLSNAVTDTEPFVFECQRSALHRFFVEVVTLPIPNARGLLLAIRRNGDDIAYCDYSQDVDCVLQIIHDVQLATNDIVTIELRIKNTLNSAQVLSVMSTDIEIE